MTQFCKYILATLVGLLLASPTLAQDCGAILAHGIWEGHDTSSDAFESSSFANWACSNSQSNTGIGVGYAGFEIKYSNQEVRDACSTQEGRFMLSESFKSSYTSASREIASAWANCMDDLGGHASVSYGSDANQFTIMLRYQGQETTASSVKLRSNTPNALGACAVAEGELADGFQFIREDSVSCTRPVTGSELRIDATFASGGGSSTLVIPYVPPAPPCTAPDNCLGLIGSYGIGALQPCAGAHGFASIRVENGELFGQNECGMSLRIVLSADGELAMGGFVGSFDAKNRVIFWSNDTQWINTEAKLSMLGNWQTAQPQCGGQSSIAFNSEGHLAATNECNQGAHLKLNADLSVVAAEWNRLLGQIDGDTIRWANNTYWTR